jgi:hypothetical protein
MKHRNGERGWQSTLGSLIGAVFLVPRTAPWVGWHDQDVTGPGIVAVALALGSGLESTGSGAR